MLEAPPEESCLYCGATYLLTVEFPADYPQHAPVVRFVSPIVHVNVNAHGRVCHGLLGRDWSAGAQARDVFDALYGLLLVPDKEDALDSRLAMQAYNDHAAYCAHVRPPRALVDKTRAMWRSELEGDDDDNGDG